MFPILVYVQYPFSRGRWGGGPGRLRTRRLWRSAQTTSHTTTIAANNDETTAHRTRAASVVRSRLSSLNHSVRPRAKRKTRNGKHVTVAGFSASDNDLRRRASTLRRRSCVATALALAAPNFVLVFRRDRV